MGPFCKRLDTAPTLLRSAATPCEASWCLGRNVKRYRRNGRLRFSWLRGYLASAHLEGPRASFSAHRRFCGADFAARGCNAACRRTLRVRGNRKLLPTMAHIRRFPTTPFRTNFRVAGQRGVFRRNPCESSFSQSISLRWPSPAAQLDLLTRRGCRRLVVQHNYRTF